jgi:REP element-mobilizing transposase RayT
MEPLQPDTSYHIFNHANGFENVFRKEENFYFFLEKYRLYISPIAETYAYCLMPNHFHLVVRIRKREAIEALIRNKNTTNFSKVSNLDKSVSGPLNEYDITKSINFGKVERVSGSLNEYDITKSTNFGKVEGKVIGDSDIEKFLSKQFANLFSSYTQSFNKVYRRMGSLFIKNFKREPIHDKTHFLNVIVYTHRNPVHHGFCSNYEDLDYSSYNEIIRGICDQIELEKLLKMTNGIESFKEMHRNELENFTPINELKIPPHDD